MTISGFLMTIGTRLIDHDLVYFSLGLWSLGQAVVLAAVTPAQFHRRPFAAYHCPILCLSTAVLSM